MTWAAVDLVVAIAAVEAAAAEAAKVAAEVTAAREEAETRAAAEAAAAASETRAAAEAAWLAQAEASSSEEEEGADAETWYSGEPVRGLLERRQYSVEHVVPRSVLLRHSKHNQPNCPSVLPYFKSNSRLLKKNSSRRVPNWLQARVMP